MKVKLDENLPTRLLVALRQRGHDVQTVPEERLTGRPDADVWAAAQQEERLLITQILTSLIGAATRPDRMLGC